MDDLLIVCAIAVLVIAVWSAVKYFGHDEEPATKPLEMKLKPDPLEATQTLRPEQFRPGPDTLTGEEPTQPAPYLTMDKYRKPDGK